MRETNDIQTIRPHVSDVLDYEKDIKPYHVIEILAGTGAGKNYFVEKLAEDHKTLIITSRAAKVKQTVAKQTSKGNNYTRYIDYDSRNPILLNSTPHDWQDFVKATEESYYIPGCYHEYEKRRTDVVTNAMVEYYYANCYIENDHYSTIENIYDIVVVDEVHSLFTDSSYQTSPFYVNNLIFRLRFAFQRGINRRCKHLILMTATPDVYDKNYIDGMGRYICDKNYFSKLGRYKKYDLRKQCYSVHPDNIWLRDTDQAWSDVEKIVNADNKVIYFFNHITDMLRFYLEKVKNGSIPEEKVAVSYSDTERRDKLTDKAKQNMELLENTIADKSLLPDGKYLFLTTSRYKEGIDLLDNFYACFVESHNQNDILQMMGRLRKGVKNLIIIENAKGFFDPAKYKNCLVDREEEQAILHTLNDLLAKKDNKSKIDFIERIQNKHQYIRFNRVSHQFEYYFLREKAEDYIKQSVLTWKMGDKSHDELLRDWFDNPDIIVYPYKSTDVIKIESFNKYFHSHYKIGEKYSLKDIEPLEKYIKTNLNITYLNSALKKINVEVKRSGNSKTKDIRIFAKIA